MSTIVRVDLSTEAIQISETSGWAGLGGRALTSTMVRREVPPDCHPLSALNKLVIAPGLLSGTTCPNSGRLSIGAKSPLTGGIKESNVGGNAAAKLARLGVAALVIEGQAPAGKLLYLVINKDGVSIQDASSLRSAKNYDLNQALAKNRGAKNAVLSIGPAGENKMGAASIAVTDLEGRPSRHAGRGGLGAVMGSKGLKAIVVDDAGGEGVTYADHDAFKKAAGTFRDALGKHPVTMKGGGLSVFGTNVLVSMINAVGAFPTRNFSSGQFENAAKISGEALHKIITERGGKTTASGCASCIIQCSNVYLDKDKNYLTSALEYETVWAHGANLGIDDLDAIALIDRLCDDYGFDTIDVGCAIGVAMAAGVINWGDHEAAINLVHEAGRGTPLGRIIGGGAALAGRAFGVENVPAVKGQALSAYDPRGIKGQGVTFATSPMGADHTAGYAAAANLMRIGGKVPPAAVEGQVELSRRFQVNAACLDSAGLCSFVSFAILDNADAYNAIPQMIAARHGGTFSLENFLNLGRNVLKTEVEFNREAGFTQAHDRLPAFLTKNPIGAQNNVFDVPPAELDKVFDF